MPVIRKSVLAGVLAHRRNDNAIGNYEIANADRREQVGSGSGEIRRRLTGSLKRAHGSSIASEAFGRPLHIPRPGKKSGYRGFWKRSC